MTKNRERLVNAIVHRDYFEEGAGTLVEIYDDIVEIRILGFCPEERSASEIIHFTGMNPDYIRKDIIPKLLEKGFLVLTIPNKPRSPHQKYILTEAGMKHVKTM